MEMTDYSLRLVDIELDDLLPELPAIALEGPRTMGSHLHLTGSATQRPGDTSRECRAGLVMHPSIGI
jgi:hypothetical protein